MHRKKGKLFQFVNGEITVFSLMVGLAILYLIFRSFSTFPLFSDENIYINMANAVSEGLLPYKDFFYAHPPLQLFLFQAILQIFGPDFHIIKIFIAAISIGSVILTFLIAKEMFGEMIASFSSLFFLVFPGFLIFSSQGIGMFEALLFFLLGFLFLLKKRFAIAALFVALSIFTRYMVIMMVPLLLLYLFQYDRKNFLKFTKLTTFAVFSFGAILAMVFGENFLIDTMIYHTQVNLNIDVNLAQWLDQYLVLGFFTIFLSITAIFFSFMKKDYRILLLAAYPLIYDMMVLFSLKAVIYHYFVLSLPFLFIAIGAMFAKAEYLIAKMLILVILVFALATNMQSILLYSDEGPNDAFSGLVDYVNANSDSTDAIFGEPRTTNYISFATGRRIANNYFDSDSKFINFAGREEVFSRVYEANPKILIIDNNQNYVSELDHEYILISNWEVPSYYTLSLYRRK